MTIAHSNNDDLQALEESYKALTELGLDLDLTRGKPAPEQLALSDSLDGILQGNYRSDSGVDVRNYGELMGLFELRELFGELFDLHPDEIMVGGNSSLNLMYLALEYALQHSNNDGGVRRFLCPAPGYDRHFSVCERLGLEMISVPLNDNGPDMDVVESLLADDDSICGIWCVPRFSNPTGCVYSDDTVARIARLPQHASGPFTVMWDNAYAVHALTPEAPALASISKAAREAGTLASVLQFGSTSKVTFAGAGVAFLGADADWLSGFAKHLSFRTIGPDKVNQLRHLRFLPDVSAIEAHMARQAALIKPKFEAVLQVLEKELAGQEFGQWTTPQGGYFISFDTLPGLAKNVVALAAAVGVKLTPAGATYPYGQDPTDSNIRLAPTYPCLEDVERCAQVFALCVKLATLRAAQN